MRKADVVIGGLYRAKVSGDIVVVRIESENIYGGWNARSTRSGRAVRIRSAQRLRERVDEQSHAHRDELVTRALGVAPGERVRIDVDPALFGGEAA